MLTRQEIEEWYKDQDYRHVVEQYKDWQPQYAAYNNWTDERARQEQAIREMVSEAAEVLGVVTKAYRKTSTLEREKVLDELGDTFWGLVGVMNTFGFTFEELCEYNKNKLEERYKT